MRERLRVLIAAIFYYSGLVKLAYSWIRHSGPRLVILNYHRATGGNLDRQLLYLRRHYHILPLETALEEFYGVANHEAQGRRTRDRRIPLVLTFDDGYRDNYTYAFPLARQLQIPITIFLIPGYIESGACFWWLEANALVEHAQVCEVTIEGITYHLGPHNPPDCVRKEQRALANAIDMRLSSARSVREREAFLVRIREDMAIPANIREVEAAHPLTWAQVNEMHESGWVTFGAHTLHHPVLAHLKDPAEVREEVEKCRSLLEQHLGHPIATFAYPIGKLAHIGDEGLLAVKAAGYKWAVTTIEGVNTLQTDPYLLRRLPGDLDLHWLVMASELVGLLGIWSRLKRKLVRR